MNDVEMSPNGERLPPVDWAAPPDNPVAELERQMERGSQFTQAALAQVIERLSAVEGRIGELFHYLGAETEEASSVGGSSEPSEPSESQASAGEEVEGLTDAQLNLQWPSIALANERDETKPRVEVNCAERMHVCHAVCCKLSFALTSGEVESGRVKWDLGFPYFIRHGTNSYCTHNDTATGRCNVYADRPGVCRRYSCANDPRIWKDFDNMVLNEEWIRGNLSARGHIAIRSLPVMEIREGGEPVQG
ncbi:MAG TPA: YkgJ family cysteine cluster protein [Actinomycetota bacterium]|nr:YkgJ family cysteine cluster protein [Actinomycetota bacterium]